MSVDIDHRGTLSDRVVATSRAVRIVMTTAVLLGLGVLAGFNGWNVAASGVHGHESARSLELEPLAAAVRVQEARGLACGTEPRFTDTVLFERPDSPRIEVLTFRQAVAATSSSQGWIRSYCVTSA